MGVARKIWDHAHIGTYSNFCLDPTLSVVAEYAWMKLKVFDGLVSLAVERPAIMLRGHTNSKLTLFCLNLLLVNSLRFQGCDWTR